MLWEQCTAVTSGSVIDMEEKVIYLALYIDSNEMDYSICERDYPSYIWGVFSVYLDLYVYWAISRFDRIARVVGRSFCRVWGVFEVTWHRQWCCPLLCFPLPGRAPPVDSPSGVLAENAPMPWPQYLGRLLLETYCRLHAVLYSSTDVLPKWNAYYGTYMGTGGRLGKVAWSHQLGGLRYTGTPRWRLPSVDGASQSLWILVTFLVSFTFHCIYPPNTQSTNH